MIARLLLAVATLPFAAFAQLQLFLYDGSTETAVGALTDFGTVAVGDTKELRFRARNNTGTAISLQTLALAGQGFTITSAPSLPYIVAPTNFTEIRVRFGAASTATYSATLAVNQVQTLLRATVIAAAAISVQGTGILASGGTVDFGRVQKGQSASRVLQISNPNATGVSIQTCSLSGAAFQAQGLQCPMTLAPGANVNVTITFAPTVSGAQNGSVAFDSRVFQLSATAFDPPLPKPTVRFDTPLASGSQQRLVISLESMAQSSGTGTVALTFRPASSNMNDDPAIVFTGTGSRTLSFTVKQGDQTASFPTGVDTTFQTGTTAGTITFQVKLADADLKFDFPIEGAAIAVDTATSVRRTGTIDVSITGYDNTGSAGRFSFTFYDSTGSAVQPGAITTDWTQIFANYFHLSKAGGSFTMRASFPVSGDASKITAVDIQMTNSVGVTRTSRLSF